MTKRANRLAWPIMAVAMIALLLGSTADVLARVARSKATRKHANQGQTFGLEADESVAEQVNDPTAFLREIRIDTIVEHGAGANHTTIEWIPTIAFPIGQGFRFEGGIPLLANGPGDRNEVEWGDVFASLAYIFQRSDLLSTLVDFRIDLPTGNEERGAGLNVSQWHASLGSVFYAFADQNLLLIPFIEYRQSIFDQGERARVSSLIGNIGLVYLLSENSYLRGEWTINLDERNDWRDSGLLNVEVGRIFMDRYSVAVGYEFDLWGDAELRNAASLSLGYLF